MTYIPSTKDNCSRGKIRRNFSSGSHTTSVVVPQGTRTMILGVRPEYDGALLLHHLSMHSDVPILWEIYYSPSVLDAIWKDVGSAAVTNVGSCNKLYNLCGSGYIGSVGQHILNLDVRNFFSDPLLYQHDTIVIMASPLDATLGNVSCMISWSQLEPPSHLSQDCNNHD